jgi:hypothetical protein
MKSHENVIRLSVQKSSKLAWKTKTSGLVLFIVSEMATQVYKKICVSTFYKNWLSGSPVITWEQTKGDKAYWCVL